MRNRNHPRPDLFPFLFLSIFRLTLRKNRIKARKSLSEGYGISDIPFTKLDMVIYTPTAKHFEPNL